MAERLCNLIKNGGGMNEYSTSETFTGKYWTDGRPIYRRVFEGQTPASAGTVTLGTISNMREVITASIIVWIALVIYSAGYPL